MKFRAVLFDAAETLFTTRGSVGEIYAGIARQHGSLAEPRAIQDAFIRHFKGSGPVSADEKSWWRSIVYSVFEEVGMVENFDEFFDNVYDRFRDSSGWILFPETVDTLRRLKQLGLKLGIISNFDSRIYSVLDSLQIRVFFNTVTISSETGFSKPEPRIFEAAIRSLEVPPPSILMVGDSPRDDIEPAIQAGMRAVLIDRLDAHRARSHLRRISSLSDAISEVTS